MVNVKFQRASATLLTLLMLIPGAGFAALPLLAPVPAPDVVPAAARALADKAFVGAFGELDAVPGAGDLASLQPSLESILRVYAEERGFLLSPPLTPDVAAKAALPAALQALGTATGHVPTPDELLQAATLPDELQQALARIVMAYLQAAQEYAAATAGLTYADLARVARGEPPSIQPDAGRMASAALLLDRAVRESAPALRKWGLLLELEERTTHPRLADFGAEGLLRAGAQAQSLRDAADLASVMQGFLPTQGAFEPQSDSAGASFLGLYEGLGIPVTSTDRIAFQLLDQQSPALQALAIVLGDGLLQAARSVMDAEMLVSQDELDAAYATLARLDLAALRTAEPETLDLAPLEQVVEVLRRADQAYLKRLEAAAILSDALDIAGDLAPLVSEPSTDSHKPISLPKIPIGVSGVGECVLGETASEEVFLDCPAPVGNQTLFDVQWRFDPGTLSLTVWIDKDDDGEPHESEVVLRTPSLADASNDIFLKDPYGFVLVGGNGHSVFDTRYAHVNLSLRAENGTIREERSVLYDGAQSVVVRQAFDLLGGLLLGTDVNRTLFQSQAEGVINFTVNPQNVTLLSLDLGGDDLYTHQPGGANEVLRVYNSSFSEGLGRTLFGNNCSPVFLFPVALVILGECRGVTYGMGSILDFVPVGDFGGTGFGTGNQVVIPGLNLNNPGERGYTQLNFSNASLPLRLGVAVDLSGNDHYEPALNYSLGASDRGLGILWDRERCHPEATIVERGDCAEFSLGHDVYLSPPFAQGSGSHRGVGLFLDERGNDVHVAGNHSLGDGFDRGVGLALDLEGNDRWFGENYTMGTGGLESLDDMSIPMHERLGLGLLLDRRGADSYGQVNASSNQGNGWPALGLLLDLGGVDQGLQVELTATGPFGAVGVGLGDNRLLFGNGAGTQLATFLQQSAERGYGGGLVVDAELPDTGLLVNDLGAAPSQGFGVGATELQGETGRFDCPGSTTQNPVFVALFGDPVGAPPQTSKKCEKREDGNFTWTTLSHQKFLLRVPGAFGIGGLLSNDGFEAPRNDEEHLLQFDLGGNDVYIGPHAGAAVPNLTALDTEGNQGTAPDPNNNNQGTPENEVNVAPLLQGGLVAPISLLVDAVGSDVYDARTGTLGGARRNLTTPSLGGAWMGIALLHDIGSSAAGLDPLGRPVPAACAAKGVNDVYVGFNRTMGYGALYGIGALVDAAGNDCYVAFDGDSGAPDTTLSYSLGAGRLGGVGVLLDARGDDRYLSGNFSQGVGVLEPTNEHLPRRVGPSNIAQVEFHDETGALAASTKTHVRTAPHSLGALLDARGRDAYSFGLKSQGYGEARRNLTLNEPNPTVGARKTIAGLFVDDGFENDTYTNASWAPVFSGHRDNSFWCSQPNLGALRPELGQLAETLRGLDDQEALDAVRFPGGPPPQVGSADAEVDRLATTAAQGPNAEATCLRLELSTAAASTHDLGTMGRGFDNLDFFANVILATSTFAQEYVRARSILSSPAVVDIGCTGNFSATVAGNCSKSLEGLQRIDAQVLWGPSSFLYNANQLLRHICTKATGDDAACLALLFGEGAVRARDVCQTVLPGKDPVLNFYDCAALTPGSLNVPVGVSLNITADTLSTGLLGFIGDVQGGGTGTRRVEFYARPNATDDDVLLGAYDRRLGLRCFGNFTDCPPSAPKGNVSEPDTTGTHRLRWDTLAVLNDTDGLPRLQTPDGRYNIVVKAYWQPDGQAGLVVPEGPTLDLAQDDQRYALNRLGDEYGFYPGVGVKRVALDNAPVVYQLDYDDISLALDDEFGTPNHELRLNITASPRIDHQGNVFGPAYTVQAQLLALEEGRQGLQPRAFPCPSQDSDLEGEEFERADLSQVTCKHTPANETGLGEAARERIVAGVGEGEVRGTLNDGLYLLQVDVREPAHGDFGERGAAQCFLLHGLALQNSIPAPEAPCNGTLAVDSIRPVTVATFHPVRVGADGLHYINRSVAYPDPANATIAARSDLTIPLRFDTLNLADKRSPVLVFDVRAKVVEFGVPGESDDKVLVTAARRFIGEPLGNLSITVCLNTDIRGVHPEPCAFALNHTSPGSNLKNESDTRFAIEVQVSARDLAGNVDPALLREDGSPHPEDTGILDVDPPLAKTCRPEGTSKTGIHEDIPRIRTRERVVPMPWDSSLAGCQGEIPPSDNHGVEAVLIAYNVTDPDDPVEASGLVHFWEPPAAQQQDKVARFDFDARGLNATLVNNKTLQFMAVARDFAGNLQDRRLDPWRTTYDDHPPEVALLNLTADHGSITYRWFARDMEAPPARVAKTYVEWGTANATTGLPQLDNVEQAAFGGTTARAVLDGLLQNTTYYLRAVSEDDVGNLAALPLQAVHTDPIARIDILTPKPGDVLVGSVPLRFNVSDVRVDPVLHYDISLVLVTANRTLTLEVENLTRRECIPPEPECPTALNATTVVRNIPSAKFPDAREAWLRIAVNNSINPGNPYVVSVGPLKIDNSPPLTQLNIIAQGGPVWWRTAAMLLLEPVDNITEVVHTEYSFDNFTFLPYNASAPPVQDREGSIPFFFRSVDAVGNVEELRLVTINVDKQRPFGNLTINKGARATSDPNVTILLEAKDGLSGIANITIDTGAETFELERPARFGTPRTFPVTLAAGEGERRVRARLTDLAGNIQELKASILVDTSPPEVSALRVESVGHTRASLSWRTSEPSITRIEYGPAAAEVLANRFQASELGVGHNVALQGLRPSLVYAFRVVAEDELGNRATVRGTFETLPDVTPPGAPHTLQALDLGNGAIRLTWEAAFDDVGIDHYIVLRGVAGQLDELGRAGELVFIDDRGIPGATYDYAVQAVDLAGQLGPASAIASQRATTRPVLSDGAVTPDKGTSTTVYTYSVLVRDPDGDAPSSVRVRISGRAVEMKPQFEGRADFAQGVLYTLETRLPATTLTGGFPTYQFEAADGRGVVQWPDVPLAGPAVLGPGALIPGLTAASNLFGLPGFEVLLILIGAGIALAVLHVRRRGAK